MSARLALLFAIVGSFLIKSEADAQRPQTGGVAGVVVGDTGAPVSDATVVVSRSGGSQPQTATTTSRGEFRIGSLEPGLYRVVARRIGFREARLPFLRVMAGSTSEVQVTLTASPTQLSTVEIRVTPTSINAETTEIARRIEVADVGMVPMGRDASSLVDLVPGSKRGFIWGGAGDAANNYQIDGVSVNHPGTGGAFLSPSIDWIEALEVRGLGSGAEHGGFQGGIVNAITRTGTNAWKAAIRTNLITPSTTATNLLPNEEGAEQSLRHEMSADMAGPLIKDRLFYFLGAAVIDRRVQVPDLFTGDPYDVRPIEQEFRDVRGIGKLTFRPGPLDRIDALVGHTDNQVENGELDGMSDQSSSLRVRSPATFYEVGWSRAGVSSAFDARLAGFKARETRLGYAGDNVPGIEIFTPGRRPVFQNAKFNDRIKPASIGGSVSWSNEHLLLGGSNRIVLGAELTRGSWTKDRTRNGGLTWMPYVDRATFRVDPARADTWLDAANEWGGAIHIDADVEDLAVYFQDYLTPFPGLTVTPGLRYGRWTGWLTPAAGSAGRFQAVRDQAFDPRIGVVWDVSGKSDFVLKAHVGRYHQAMSALFFDRAEGGSAYENERLYYQGPPLTDPATVFTPEQRDANLDTFTGFSPTFVETILNEAGRVENYRQPFVDQATLSLEKRFGPRWKVELSFTNRVNKDIVGLVDRNQAENYSPLSGVTVRDRIFFTTVFDHHGNPLELPTVWVSNFYLRQELISRQSGMLPRPPVPGYTFADISRLEFNPDIVLTTVPDAKRRMNQVSVVARTQQEKFSWFGSASYTSLWGNVAGLTGFGTSGVDFTAGPGVRPNERTNYEGRLPNIPAFDFKTWITGNIPFDIEAGAFASMTLGEYFEPAFRITPRFRFYDEADRLLPDSIFLGVIGQNILLEERGTRKYPADVNLDLRLEKRFQTRQFRAVVSADLFNALASGAIIQRNLTVNDQISTDPTSVFGAPRRRVAPMRLQLGLRLEH
ncbi:MAG: TonB-dependent receptor [Gemmatimonadaceae bacterium]